MYSFFVFLIIQGIAAFASAFQVGLKSWKALATDTPSIRVNPRLVCFPECPIGRTGRYSV
jgi:hypothetical protein